MYKKDINYTDFDGNQRTETAYFGFTEAELTKMELSIDGGLTAYMDLIVQEQSTPKIMTMIEELIDKSYGRKSLDGRKFEKSPEILADFKSTQAYSDFFTEVALDQEKATAFILGIMPNNLQEKVAEAAKAGVLGNANLNEEQRKAIQDAMAISAGTASAASELSEKSGTDNITSIQNN